jgi:transcriptional regulator with XRE-family HTH domain
MSYAERIKEVRKENGLSQEQLAEKLNVSRQCITKWESGTCYPGVDNLLTMAQRFNV